MHANPKGPNGYLARCSITSMIQKHAMDEKSAICMHQHKAIGEHAMYMTAFPCASQFHSMQ